MTTVLDGGLSTVLQARGHDLADDLWTARLLRDDPAEIVAAHRTYFEAGADVATTASYQASVPSLVSAGCSVAEAESLLRLSVRLAADARDAHDRDGLLVAASVGPYGAILGDGSEYRGRYGLTRTELADFHRPRLELLAECEPDLFAVETIPDVVEAQVLVELLDDLGLPAWFSYSIEDGRTRAGQDAAEAFAVAASSAAVVAVGVNCCDPLGVLGAVELVARVAGKPAIAYPNAGEDWDADAHTWVGRSTYDPALVPSWLAAGADWVGGCCRVGPDAIAGLAAMVAGDAGSS